MADPKDYYCSRPFKRRKDSSKLSVVITTREDYDRENRWSDGGPVYRAVFDIIGDRLYEVMDAVFEPKDNMDARTLEAYLLEKGFEFSERLTEDALDYYPND